ncbi:MAG: glycosyltransferase [Patescibacteria group bacterium]|nr:glycosyltransferase [Patescibacteria group bacterium]
MTLSSFADKIKSYSKQQIFGYLENIKYYYYYFNKIKNIEKNKKLNQEKKVLMLTGTFYSTQIYRCLHQREQLEIKNIVCDYKYISLITLKDILSYDVFIFHRVRCNKFVNFMIDRIHSCNKKIIFDIDDLIFDPSSISNIPTVITKKDKLKRSQQYLDTLKKSDFALTTTNYLADILRKYKPSFINRNALSNQQISSIISKKVLKNSAKINIGYISGSNSHDQDFKIIEKPLISMLKKYPNVNLYIFGFLRLGKAFDIFKSQIIRIPFVPWEKMLDEVAKFDINVAPLRVSDCFCESKSEIKFIEAGLLSIPTIASPTEAFKYAILNNVNGYLAEDEKQWTDCMEMLITDRVLRKKIGKNANKAVMKNYCPQYRSENLFNIINEVLEKNQKA